MVIDKTKIVGTFRGGDEVVLIGINMLCSVETTQNICEMLRQEANNLGEQLDITVTISMEDI